MSIIRVSILTEPSISKKYVYALRELIDSMILVALSRENISLCDVEEFYYCQITSKFLANISSEPRFIHMDTEKTSHLLSFLRNINLAQFDSGLPISPKHAFTNIPRLDLTSETKETQFVEDNICTTTVSSRLMLFVCEQNFQ